MRRVEPLPQADYGGPWPPSSDGAGASPVFPSPPDASEMLTPDAPPRPHGVLERLIREQACAVLTFGGNSLPWVDELAQLYERSLPARQVIEAAAAALSAEAEAPALWRSGLLDQGLDVCLWLTHPEQRPDVAYLSSSLISQPMIFVTQMAQYAALYEEGLRQVWEVGGIAAVTGHSQGVMPAILVSEAAGAPVDAARVAEIACYYLWQGLHMQRSCAAAPEASGATPMAAVSRASRAIVVSAVERLNAALPPEGRLTLALHNTRTRHVVSGPPGSLERLRLALEQTSKAQKEAKARGRLAGSPIEPTWEYLAVSSPFHTPHMAPGLEVMRATVASRGWHFDARRLSVPVLSPFSGEPLNSSEDLTEALLVFQFLEPVRWDHTLTELVKARGVTHVLDLGPSDAVARMSRSVLRGSGKRVLALATPEGRRELRGEIPAVEEQDFREFAPRLVRLEGGELFIDNRFTRFTGRPPVLLPGMTPTTAEVPIVAAAARAGYVSELAGGGQVTEAIFRERVEELKEALPPGQQVVFNALYLDPWLWNLHVRERGLLKELKREGAPFCGITVSAGVPEVAEAVALLAEMEGAGLWLNAFKPGTVAQIDAVLRIARARPESTLVVQIEGGKAGGHHSWEELDELLLETYPRLRELPNVVVAVGGGIADEARAVSLLTGEWALAHGAPVMPVDAVFLGTLAMACAEAGTSPAVKQALVEANGTPRWVFSGDVEGGVTSGKSGLGADIWYLDNPASRVARLLDEVAGDGAAVERRRGEIIAALAASAKPYFGDLTTMTYLSVLERMVELMAIGRGGRYEDGVWPDASYRQRVMDFALRAQERLLGEGEAAPLLSSPADLDVPAQVVQRLAALYPAAATTHLHPVDVDYFVQSICARPGKPVNFVPVLDADVRRWYKSDALWQSHDPRYDAGQVLVIPGPDAVRGIHRADEPVGELLGRFERALIQRLSEGGAAPRRVAGRHLLAPPLRLPPGIVAEKMNAQEWILAAEEGASPHGWLSFAASRLMGPLARILARARVSYGHLELESPLWSVCRAERGARLSLVLGEGNHLERVSWQSVAGERLTAICRGPAVTVELTPKLAAAGAAPLRLLMQAGGPEQGEALLMDPGLYAASLRSFYLRALFGEEPASGDLFSPRTGTTTAADKDLADYAALTGGPIDDVTARGYAFSRVWRPLFRVLSHPELAGGLLHLVHLSNELEPGPAWPVQPEAEVQVSAALTHLLDDVRGRTLQTRCEVQQGGQLAYVLTSRFYVRLPHGHLPWRARVREPLVRQLTLRDEASLAFFVGHSWVTIHPGVELRVGDTLTLSVERGEELPTRGPGRRWASGLVLRGGESVGAVKLDVEGGATHPLDVLLELLGASPSAARVTPALTLATATTRAPRDLRPFAALSLDGNPIHLSPVCARLAGLEGPIVHGMWTAARCHAFLVQHVALGDSSRVKGWRVEFLAPTLPGDLLKLEASRVGVDQGRQEIEIRATGPRSAAPVLRLRAQLAPPRTVYVFPGQGIQQPGMGMEGYARSAASRAVWDKADAFTRSALGFSILKVVQDNPHELIVGGESFRHEKGVLHLTQFTQVAMAVLAAAQVAELREAGVLCPDALCCGHSVGEYNAIGAITGVLPLETVVELVYQRGLTMHRLVPRDEHGRSHFGMIVIRPRDAGLDHRGAEALVAELRARCGLPLQIVNYNLRDRQYSVVGHLDALELLQRALTSAARAGGREPFVVVPGIDTPFHSDVLDPGVPAFREALRARFPREIDPAALVGRYIPNLVPRPFCLERTYVEEVFSLTHSPVLEELLADWQGWSERPAALTRALLIELLSYQFARPVRWIETQELLFTPPQGGGLGAQRLVEIGVGYQPTLANMARATLADLGARAVAGVQVLNVEAQRAQVFEEEASAPPAAVAEAPAPAAVSAAVSPAAPVAPPAATAGAPIPALPVTVEEALRALLAIQARVRPEQIGAGETIEALLDGVSSRRNQVLMDIGAEFGVPAIDGAHEKALSALVQEIERRAPRYAAPGRYLKGAMDEALTRALGRAGMGRKDAAAWLSGQLGLPEESAAGALLTLTLELREGVSGRGGALGELPATPATRAQAQELLQSAAQRWAASHGVALAGPSAGAAAAAVVDSAQLNALEARILGPGGALMAAARALATGAGVELAPPGEGLPARDELKERLDRLTAEHGAEYEALVAPRFDPARHVAFEGVALWAQRDVARLYFEAVQGHIDGARVAERARELASHRHARVAQTARWYAAQAAREGRGALAAALTFVAEGGEVAPIAVIPSRPARSVDDSHERSWTEEFDRGDGALDRFITSLRLGQEDALVQVGGGAWDEAFGAWLKESTERALDFTGRTALVTGAGPGSIALAVVRMLLRGGARVVLTTSSYTPSRLAQLREVYQRSAVGAAELHVVPFNQASLVDCEALVRWCFEERTEQAGATTRVVKRPFAPDLLIPFAALPDHGSLEARGGRSWAAQRALLLGTEQLLGALCRQYRERGARERGAREHGAQGAPLHVLLPLSPNHGGFGGDGTYAESKAGLEVLTERWRSEHERWGRFTTLAAARIGWVRGTGLMEANDALAAELEATTALRTFSQAEMAWMLAALCVSPAREAARAAPLEADLTGGFTRVGDLRARVDTLQARLTSKARARTRLEELKHKERKALGGDASPARVMGLPSWPLPEVSERLPLPLVRPAPAPQVDLSRTVVIVGVGEIGPWGSARTRFEAEVEDRLSPAAVVELAWLTGLIRYERGPRASGWIDVATGEAVPEQELAARYHDEVKARSGIRIMEKETVGFSPTALPVLAPVFLERDLSFTVGSEEEARLFIARDPDSTRVQRLEDGRWQVTRLAGTTLHVPRQMALRREVAGQLPRGFDLARLGIPREMIDNVDRLSLFNLVATVEAFLAAGLTPEQLLARVHPARVGNTQGAGIGGMNSLRRLYVDAVIGNTRQSDILQETLINVVAAYVVQSYVGSYGTMSHPVAACATAAVSLEEAYDKLLADKADFVVAGGFDDIGREGTLGFSDMNATADTVEMSAMGLAPAQMSRSNDVRRKGFVEAQGGGTLLVTRADLAVEMGLPIQAVVGWAGSFGDGIQKSVPAPGLGLLAAAAGGAHSPLGRALLRYGLTADDVGLVYKHDTSTHANDPNESAIHEHLQRALGRTEGNPLFVVSQKTLTGHSKGGAAAWQIAGLIQCLSEGVIPGNRNLDTVDPAMWEHSHLAWTHAPLRPGPGRLKAGLVTSLGFGHVSAIALLLHPSCVLDGLEPEARERWQAQVSERAARARAQRAEILTGARPAFTRRGHRRFAAADGSPAQTREEIALLLDATARLGGDGVWHPGEGRS